MATIPYTSVITTERFPVDAQDIVTRVRLVIAGSPAGREPDRLTTYDNTTSGLVTYFGDPLVLEYEAPEHATYGCTRAFALPEGFNPFLNPDDALVPEPDIVSGFVNPGSPSAIRDGDPITYAELASGSNGVIRYAEDERFCGFRLRLEGARTVSTENFYADLRAGRLPRWVEGNVTPYGVYARWDIPRDDESAFEASAVLLHDARNRLINTSTVVDAPDMTLRLTVGEDQSGVKVHEFYPLILNEVLLEDVAMSNIRLPASSPRRVIVSGYVAPDRAHTITGWPGGDFTGAVAQHQYELGRTIIDFEQAGAPMGLPAEAIESARERTTAIRREINTANYSLVMGERQ